MALGISPCRLSTGAAQPLVDLVLEESRGLRNRTRPQLPFGNSVP